MVYPAIHIRFISPIVVLYELQYEENFEVERDWSLLLGVSFAWLGDRVFLDLPC